MALIKAIAPEGHRIADISSPEQKRKRREKIFAFLPGLPPPVYHITHASHTRPKGITRASPLAHICTYRITRPTAGLSSDR